MKRARTEPARLTVIVHGIDHARAACRAARAAGAALSIESAPGAAGTMGPAWFRALQRRIEHEFPDVPADWVLDCGDAAGRAMAALRAGVTQIRFSRRGRARDRLAALCQAYGAALAGPARGALDLAAAPDPEAACRARLAGRAKEFQPRPD